jgi:hypothetical protein
MIGVGDEDGLSGLGSGFFVRDGVVATNYHVIDDAKAAVVKLVGKENYLTVTRVIAYDVEADLALLEVSAGYAPPMDLGDLSLIDVGDTVYAIGNPKGLEGTFSAGNISAIRRARGGHVDFIQITAPISSGSSGGPVLDEHGRVIGVATASMRDGQNLNLAIPVADLINLMNKPVPPPAPIRITQQPAPPPEKTTRYFPTPKPPPSAYVDADPSPAMIDGENRFFTQRTDFPAFAREMGKSLRSSSSLWIMQNRKVEAAISDCLSRQPSAYIVATMQRDHEYNQGVNMVFESYQKWCKARYK